MTTIQKPHNVSSISIFGIRHENGDVNIFIYFFVDMTKIHTILFYYFTSYFVIIVVVVSIDFMPHMRIPNVSSFITYPHRFYICVYICTQT